MSEANVDRQLVSHFERSWARQDEARRLLPARWLDDRRPAAQQLNDLFLDLLERARVRVESERAALDLPRVSLGDLRD